MITILSLKKPARISTLVLIAAMILTFPSSTLPVVSAQEEPSITVSYLGEPDPVKWGMQVDAFGFVTSPNLDDTVTITWGDGTAPETGFNVTDGTWGPASHTYDVSAVGQHEILVKLINSTNHEIASSSLTIDVAPTHFTSIIYDPINAVTQAQNITVTGTLIDQDLSGTISNIEIDFIGTGAAGLPNATTDALGFFNITGPSPNIAEDALEIQASLNSAIYDDPSEVATYDTFSINAQTFPVAAGLDVTVDLIDFDASLVFENVLTNGTVLAYGCAPPSNDRYIEESSAGCLNIRPSVDMAVDSTVQIIMSLSDVDTSEVSLSELHMFRVDGSSASDITLDVDTDNSQIVGKTGAFSRFVVAIPEFPEQAPHSKRVPIYLGNNTIDFRNVDSNANVSAVINIDDSTIRIGEPIAISITDQDENINSDLIDSVSATVSSTSSPAGVTLSFEETSDNSGVFAASLGTTTGSTTADKLHVERGDQIFVNYTQSGGRLRAVIQDVIEGGYAEMLDYTFDPDEQISFLPIGGAVEVSIPDLQVGSIIVTMSYANADLRGQLPQDFKLMHYNGSWVDITVPDGPDEDTISDGVNQTAMTVTSIPISNLSPLVIGVETGIFGGAGGGGFTGRGVVVDAVASIVRSSGGGGGGSSSSSTGSSVTSFVAQLAAGSNIKIDLSVPPTSVIKIEFEKVLTPGNLVVEQKSPASLNNILSEAEQEKGKVVLEDDLVFTTAGTIFDIKPVTGVTYEGAIYVTIPYNKNLLEGSSASNMRFLHYDGKVWEDTTIEIDETAGTVTGRILSLSPVVAAVVNDGTFAAVYFEQNPLSKIASIEQSSGTIVIDAKSEIILLNAEGSKITNGVISAGSEITVVNSIKNLQRAPQSYTYILEVLDSDGVAIDLIIARTGVLERAQSSTINVEWTASEMDGEYSFKVFVVDDSNQKAPILLKNSISYKVEVT
jgi:hypothetical protein